MFRKIALLASAVTLSSLTAVTSQAQTTGTQVFTVTVPQSISIVAPSAVNLIHDLTDNPQAFPVQTWLVRGNTSAGVSVALSTSTPFTHVTNVNAKRDVKLDLSVGATQGTGAWTVGIPTDTSNFVANDNEARVTVSSNGVGRANLNLTVSFLTGEFGTFAEGDYVTTVTGTVAAN